MYSCSFACICEPKGIYWFKAATLVQGCFFVFFDDTRNILAVEIKRGRDRLLKEQSKK